MRPSWRRLWRILGIAGLGVIAASCGTAQTAATSVESVPANFAAIVPGPSGAQLVEVQSYQHGQVFMARGGGLELATPLGISTRAGVVLSPTVPMGASVLAGEVAHGTWPDSVIWTLAPGGWLPQELSVAVAPYAGSVVSTPAGGVAIVGATNFGAANQEIVALRRDGSISRVLVPTGVLRAAARAAGCAHATFRAVDPTGAWVVGSCGASTLLRLSLDSRTVLRTQLSGALLGSSAVVTADGRPVTAILVGGGRSERLTLVDVATGVELASAQLGAPASAAPSIAAAGSMVAVAVPEGGRGQVVTFAPGSPAKVVAAPAQAQGVGLTSAGSLEVVSADPNGTQVTLWSYTGSGWRRAAVAETPTVSQG